ncbi:MAG: hypothetical protein ACI4DS_05585 [Eubacterium sp.]
MLLINTKPEVISNSGEIISKEQCFINTDKIEAKIIYIPNSIIDCIDESKAWVIVVVELFTLDIFKILVKLYDLLSKNLLIIEHIYEERYSIIIISMGCSPGNIRTHIKDNMNAGLGLLQNDIK